jgi:ABC-2 type transport system ATP-binding protein
VIAAGRIVAEGTPATLGARDVQKSIVHFTMPGDLKPSDLPREIYSLVPQRSDTEIEFRAEKPLPLLRTLADWGEREGVDLADLTVSRPSLEDVYLQLTREENR